MGYNIEIKLKYRDLELEIKGEKEDVEYFLNKIFEVIETYKAGLEPSYIGEVSTSIHEYKEELHKLPSITIKEGEPLTSILSKLFSDKWGREPRGLREVIEVLEAFGLYYTKSTVAVTLNRLVKRGILRRIKAKDGTYRYVYSGKVSE